MLIVTQAFNIDLMGNGALFYQNNFAFSYHSSLGFIFRCGCHHCSIQATAEECKCCIYAEDAVTSMLGTDSAAKCITEHADFSVVILHQAVLDIAYSHYRQDYGTAGLPRGTNA